MKKTRSPFASMHGWAITGVVAVLLASGCTSWPATAPEAKPGSDAAAGPAQAAWTTAGPAFPNATIAASQGEAIAVLGDSFWTWDTGADVVTTHGLPPSRGGIAGLYWNGAAWAVVQVREDRQPYACGPACDALRTRVSVYTDTFLQDTWTLTESREGEWEDGSAASQAWPEMAHAFRQEAAVRGTTYQLDTRYGGNPGSNIPAFPCRGGVGTIASDGAALYAASASYADSRCAGIRHHVWRWNAATGMWQASADKGRLDIQGRPLVRVGDRLVSLGAPSLQFRPAAASWWDVPTPHLDISATFAGDEVTFSVTPSTYPWGNATAAWHYGGIYGGSGWSQTFPYAGDGAQVRLEVFEGYAGFFEQNQQDIYRPAP